MTVFSTSGINIYETAQASVVEAIGAMATMKNVSVTPELRESMTEWVLDCMNFPDIYRVSALEKDALEAMAREVNTHLDAAIMIRMRDFIAGLEGKNDLNDPVVCTISNEIMEKFEASATKDRPLRWSEPAELVWNHYANRPRGPTTGVREDGTTCTRWWLGLEFHRDPKEGAANIEVKGDQRIEEYYVEGKRHRPHEDGPAEIIVEQIDGRERRIEAWWVHGQRHRPHEEGAALTITHYKDNEKLSGEEYFQDGKEHRPSQLGPAITQWDGTGRTVLQFFMEDGRLHRDPKEGPASFVIRDPITLKETEDNVTIIQYCVRGEKHRDEQEGPAVMVCDNRTGVLLREIYDQEGRACRKDGPAVIERNADGIVVFQAWCNGTGWFYRDPKEGPAVITHDPDTGHTTEEFVADSNDPAEGDHAYLHVTRDRDGTVVEEKLWDGEQMRLLPPRTMNAEAASG